MCYLSQEEEKMWRLGSHTTQHLRYIHTLNHFRNFLPSLFKKNSLLIFNIRKFNNKKNSLCVFWIFVVIFSHRKKKEIKYYFKIIRCTKIYLIFYNMHIEEDKKYHFCHFMAFSLQNIKKFIRIEEIIA